MTGAKFRAGEGYGREDWDAVDSPEATDAQLAEAKPFRDVFPDLAAKLDRPGEPTSTRRDQDIAGRLRSRRDG